MNRIALTFIGLFFLTTTTLAAEGEIRCESDDFYLPMAETIFVPGESAESEHLIPGTLYVRITWLLGTVVTRYEEVELKIYEDLGLENYLPYGDGELTMGYDPVTNIHYGHLTHYDGYSWLEFEDMTCETD